MFGTDERKWSRVLKWVRKWRERSCCFRRLSLWHPKGETGVLVVAKDTSGQALALSEELHMPELITDASTMASLRFINFFTAEIENDNNPRGVLSRGSAV
jgi:hypothetical protein